MTRVLSSVSGDTSLPQLDYDTLTAAGYHVPEFIERQADFDFCFDLDADSSFRSRMSRDTLDQDAGGWNLQDTSLGKYLVINSGGMKGVPTPLRDTRAMFYAGVFQYNLPESADNQVLAGSSTTDSGDGGERLGVASAGHITLSPRGHSTATITAGTLSSAGISDEDWIFVAATGTITTGTTTTHTVYVGTPSGGLSATTSADFKVLSSNDIAIGNAYLDNSDFWVQTVRCARFFGGTRSVTVAEMRAMYERAKVLCARRGVDIT